MLATTSPKKLASKIIYHNNFFESKPYSTGLRKGSLLANAPSRTKRIRRFLSQSRKIILLIATVATITLITTTLIAICISNSFNIHVPSLGTIRLIGVEAYGGDTNTTNGQVSLNLGTIDVGIPKNVSFYIRSVSNVPTNLDLVVDNWNPNGLARYMNVSWNYTGNQVAAGEEIPIRIDIDTVDAAEFWDYLIANHITSFSFSLTIKVSET